MTDKEIKNKLVEIQTIVERFLDLKLGDYAKIYNQYFSTSLYHDLEQALNTEIKDDEAIEKAINISKFMIQTISKYCYDMYKVNCEYHNGSFFFFKEEERDDFELQLNHNITRCGIYMMKDENTLVNLLDKNDCFTGTKESIEYFGGIIIVPKSKDFETEYQNYYDILKKHNFNNTQDEYYQSSAETITYQFGGKVMVNEFCIPSFSLANHSQKQHIEYMQQMKAIKTNRILLKACKLYCNVKETMEPILRKLCFLNNSFSYESFNPNIAFTHDILFLQRWCISSFQKQQQYEECERMDCYKALDADIVRRMTGNPNIGLWVKTILLYGESASMYRYNDYIPIHDYSYIKDNYPIASWGLVKTVRESENEDVYDEYRKVDNHHCTDEEIELLIKDRYVIVANKNLDYNQIIKEYYSNLDTNPETFCLMMQHKYGCDVKMKKQPQKIKTAT